MHGPQKRKICFLVYCPWLFEVTILGGIIFNGSGGTVLLIPPRHWSQSIQLAFYEKSFLLSLFQQKLLLEFQFSPLYHLDITLSSTYIFFLMLWVTSPSRRHPVPSIPVFQSYGRIVALIFSMKLTSAGIGYGCCLLLTVSEISKPLIVSLIMTRNVIL